ncbi:MAG: 2-keto-4-pentenoate hydratase [Paracoccaceae bacterium]|jgi:2-keto-4-pentenoate hydratase
MGKNLADWAKGAAATRAAVKTIALPEIDDFGLAYALQDAYVAAVAPSCGGIGGYKLAVNGKPQMAHFGVTQPASARVFTDEIYRNGVTLPRSGFVGVTVEVELAAILGPHVGDLTTPVDLDTARAAIDRFHASFELIDQRGIALPQMQLPQAIALNVMNAGVVLGDDSLAPDALALDSLRVVMAVDGDTAADTTGTAPQDPVEAVQWLINHLAKRGLRPEPGMVVMCGTHIPMITLDPGVRKVTAEMSGLGRVSFSLSD